MGNLSVTDNYSSESRPSHKIVIGSGILVPSDGRESIWMKSEISEFRLLLTKLDSTLDLGLNTIYASDLVMKTKSTEANIEEKSSLDDFEVELSGFVVKYLSNDYRKYSDEYGDSPINEVVQKEKDADFENIPKKPFVDSETSTRPGSTDLDDEFSESSFTQLDSTSYIQKTPISEDKERGVVSTKRIHSSKLLSASLCLTVKNDNLRNQFSRDELPQKNVDDTKFAALEFHDMNPKPLSRAAKARLDRYGFMDKLSQSAGPSSIDKQVVVDVQAERNDPLNLNDISIQLAGMRILPKFPSMTHIRSAFCSFQFYNCLPVTSEKYKLFYPSSEISEALFLREDGHSRDEPPLAFRFIIESLDQTESMKFITYLATSFMTIDLWDADSLMLIGIIHVSAHLRFTCTLHVFTKPIYT